MRVLVTGSNGLVGRAIARRLADAGYQTVGLGRSAGPREPVSDYIQADLGLERAADRIAGQHEPCAAIVHGAALLDTGDGEASLLRANCLGMQQALELARRWGARHFAYLSSIGVIGRPQSHPITEDHPTEPLSAYYASKLFGEHLVRLASQQGMPAASLRLTAPIGPGMPEGRILAVFVRRAMAHQPLDIAGRGTRRQNYVDVRDIAAAVELCLRAAASGLFNLGSGQTVSNGELAQACVHALDSSSPIRYSDQADPEDGLVWDVSIDRAAASFGYRPRIVLEESIRTVAAVYASAN